MKRSVLLIISALFFSIAYTQELTKLWDLEGLEAPESVVYHEGHLYVSNVSGQPAEKNGQGFISKINERGEVIELKWATGFNAPKGLGIFDGKLYVADIDELVVVNLDSGSIDQRYAAEGATFLNDVEISADGIVYITDTFGGNAIYQFKGGELSLLVKDEKLDYPNGLKLRDGVLYVASWGVVTNPETFETAVPGSLLAVDLKSHAVTKVTQETGNLDGLVNFNEGFITSDWIAGKLIALNLDGQTKVLIDLNAGSADIEYLEDQNVLLVPQMLDGKLSAYSLD